MMDSLKYYAIQNLIYGSNLVLEYPLVVLNSILAFFVLWGWLLIVQGTRRPRGKKQMSKRETERYVNSCLADIVTDGVEEYIMNGYLTVDQGNHLYRMVGNLLKAYDLLPRKSLTLKQQIRKRLFNRRPAPLIPDRPNPEVRKPVKKSFSDSHKSLKAAKA